VDVSSGREAVHDPDAVHELRQDVARYAKMKSAGELSDRDEEIWDFKITELATREKRREQTMLCEFEDEEEKHKVEQKS
jgi:hypothetical protein